MRRVKLCLPGACMTAFVPADATPTELSRAVDRIARHYETQTGRELDAPELGALRRRLENGVEE